MEEIISKKELDNLLKIEGKTRGVSIKDYGDYILKEKGEEGLKKLEETMARIGYPIKFKELRTMDFYPLSSEGITLLAIKRLFNLSDEEVKEMAGRQAKTSILVRLFMKYFFSIEKTAGLVPKMWKVFYSVGEAKTTEFDERKRYAILVVKDFFLIPLHCLYLCGYFSSIVQLVVGKKVNCEETKCAFKGDKYHEFVLKW